MNIKNSQTKVWFVAEANQIETIMNEGIKADPSNCYIQLITKLEYVRRFEDEDFEIYAPDIFAFLYANTASKKYALFEIDINGIRGALVKVNDDCLNGFISENFKRVCQNLIKPEFITHFEIKEFDLKRITDYSFSQLIHLVYNDQKSNEIELNTDSKRRRYITLRNKFQAERYASMELLGIILDNHVK